MSAPSGARQPRRMASNSAARIGRELALALTNIERTELRSYLRGELQAEQPDH